MKKKLWHRWLNLGPKFDEADLTTDQQEIFDDLFHNLKRRWEVQTRSGGDEKYPRPPFDMYRTEIKEEDIGSVEWLKQKLARTIHKGAASGMIVVREQTIADGGVKHFFEVRKEALYAILSGGEVEKLGAERTHYQKPASRSSCDFSLQQVGLGPKEVNVRVIDEIRNQGSGEVVDPKHVAKAAARYDKCGDEERSI